LNIRDLKYLVAVHDLNNFSKAAERCFVSQPTLSGQLKKLETELGSSLIERSTRQVLFTPLGNEVVLQARELLHVVERIRRIARERGDPMVGDFHIGLIPTIGPSLLPIIMPELSRTYSKAKLFLYEQKTQTLLNKLVKGELDAIIVGKENWSIPVLERSLYNEGLRLAVSDEDVLAGDKGLLPLSALRGRSVLTMESGHCLRELVLNACLNAGADEETRFQATSMDTLLHMVATGAGITLVPELASRRCTQSLDFLSFSDPVPKRNVVMLMRKNSSQALALNRIADVIETAVGHYL